MRPLGLHRTTGFLLRAAPSRSQPRCFRQEVDPNAGSGLAELASLFRYPNEQRLHLCSVRHLGGGLTQRAWSHGRGQRKQAVTNGYPHAAHNAANGQDDGSLAPQCHRRDRCAVSRIYFPGLPLGRDEQPTRNTCIPWSDGHRVSETAKAQGSPRGPRDCIAKG